MRKGRVARRVRDTPRAMQGHARASSCRLTYEACSLFPVFLAAEANAVLPGHEMEFGKRSGRSRGKLTRERARRSRRG